MYHSDCPISHISEDRLRRTEFSKQLADAILSYSEHDNFTISICGKWGSGKTSVLNMIVEQIKERTREENDKPIIVYFNPWNYSDRAQLLTQFFNEISNAIGMHSSSRKFENVGAALQKYSSALEYAAFIPVVGKYLGAFEKVASSLGQELVEIAENKASLSSQKDDVIKALEAQTQKIIVIIDDIDRLNYEQIRLIFQLVNSVAGFPNMIYILSFDKDVVVRALETEQQCDGKEYLEKIIQMPFDIPNAKKALIHEMLFEILDGIVASCGEPFTVEKDYWQSVFMYAVAPFIDTIRDVKLITNVFRFKFGLLHAETNFCDLFAMTTLQICAPEIYNWIFSNIGQLTGSPRKSISYAEQRTAASNYLEIFKTVYAQAPETMLKVVQVLFPNFSWITGGYSFHSEMIGDLRRAQRIACPERVPLYFELSLEDVSITAERITQSINDYTLVQLREFLISLLENDEIDQYIKELIARIEEIPESRLELFLEALFNLQAQSPAKASESKLYVAPVFACREACKLILQRIGKENAKNYLERNIESADSERFVHLIGVVLSIEDAYGRIKNYADLNWQLVEENSLPPIEKVVAKRLIEISKVYNFLDSAKFNDVFFLWKYLDKDSLDKYIANLLTEPQNIAKFIPKFARTWIEGNDDGWAYNEEDFSEYISAKDIYEALLRLKGTSEFKGLSHEQKQAVITYYMWYNSDRKDHQRISRSIADTLIPEWEAPQEE